MFESHQSLEDDAELVQLYSKMAQTLAVSGVVGQNPSALLSIQIPGVIVPPGLDPKDPETEYYVSNLLNAAVECNYVVTPKAGLTSDVYKLILDGKETPLIELSPHEKEKLREAENYLFEPGGGFSPAFQAYLDCAEIFYAAQDELFTAETTHENGGPDVPPAIRKRYDEAKALWLQRGNKEKVDEALATVRQLQGRDPYVYWQGLADRFARSTLRLKNGSEFQRVDSLPRYQEWFKDELWTPFSFDENDYNRQRRSGGTGMTGRCACCHCCGPAPLLEGTGTADDDPVSSGGWRDQSWILAANHGARGPAERGPRRSVATGHMTLTCSIKRVTILRPWMDVSVFHSRLWKWSPHSIGRGIVISTGGSVAGNQIATGVLPVLPTTALLAKDIELTTTSQETLDWIRTHLEAGRKVRYGPFLLDKIRSPHARERTDSPAIVGAASGAPELFGFISTIFGKCPNPDMSLPWPS
ncbi:hypothetical protein [Bradyrhizobium lablabi]|uniref:hypothetical protein n=1 Tax=Bradyrhizobium lablabi TaxID=722472 RepID=UPI001BA8337E|nr:hypothetical protein [Bradyrhizobium lablabi]MBR0695075.1 hypothetical protein [Bradyrhizobium lablabi]